MNAAEISMWLESLDNRAKDLDGSIGDLRNEMISIQSKLRPILDELTRNENETLFCTICGIKAKGLSNSLRAGWSCIIDDEGNEEGDFAGHCGGCTERLEDGAEVEHAMSPTPAESVPRKKPAESSSKPKVLGTLFPLEP